LDPYVRCNRWDLLVKRRIGTARAQIRRPRPKPRNLSRIVIVAIILVGGCDEGLDVMEDSAFL
jgi:hypothetical protein